VLADFLAAHPRIRLDRAVSGAIPGIVASGYDAGVELGEVIDRDMNAVPVTGKMRLAVVGSPAYFAHRPVPAHPRELTGHVCINWHPEPGAPAYRWEFTEDGRDFSVAVETRVLCNDGGANLRFARGELVSVLEEFLPPLRGMLPVLPQPAAHLARPPRSHRPPAPHPARLTAARGSPGRPSGVTLYGRRPTKR